MARAASAVALSSAKPLPYYFASKDAHIPSRGIIGWVSFPALCAGNPHMI